MENIIVGLILLTIVVIAIAKIYHEKKKGAKCVGCPYSQTKDSKCSCHH